MSRREDDNKQGWTGDQDQPRNEDLYSEFDDEDEFEDSDRDSDFASMYTEVEEEEPDPAAEDSTWELEEDPPEEDDLADPREPWAGQEDSEPEEPELWDSNPRLPGAFDDEPPEAEDPLPLSAVATGDSFADTEEDWEEFEDDEEFEEEENSEPSISLAMIVVAVIALVLLGAGGYGVIKQRAGMQEEIRELQAKLATAAPPREVAATRLAAEQAAESNDLLEQQVAELSRENRSLEAIVAGLEKQLAAQQAAIDKAPVATKPKPAPTPTPSAAAKPVPVKSAASSATPAAAGSWFVNFSSYTQRSTAESWVSKLQPDKGRVIVATGDSEGRTIYRVRVVDLPDRASAETIARALEKEYGLPKLWVGKSG